MNYLVVELGLSKRKLVKVADSVSIPMVISRYTRSGYVAYQVATPPSLFSICRLYKQGKSIALCGCPISGERGARCSIHNRMSWLTFYHSIL